MTSEIPEAPDDILEAAMEAPTLAQAHQMLADVNPSEVVSYFDRSPSARQAVLFRLLPKGTALQVFEQLSDGSQARLVGLLREDEVTSVFNQLDPDDRVGLLDELPAKVAKRLLHGLTPQERKLTAVVLGYADGCIGRRMSPEVIALHATMTAKQALAYVKSRIDQVETIYTLPVVEDGRKFVGVVKLENLLKADDEVNIVSLITPEEIAYANENEEVAARRCAETDAWALPVLDKEERLVGIFTLDDALEILDEAAQEDHARQGGAEPLDTPYLTTRIIDIVRSRVVWLLVLAVGAVLTVHVLERFESVLSQMVVLSIFVPLLIGTGGNTGNQAATTVTRALAVGEVRPSDALRIAGREISVGLCLGGILGTIGFSVVTFIYGWEIGQVVGLTLLSVCTLAAFLGGMIPLLAKLLRADPAVFSNPFISTLLDASGLIIYFVIAKVLLGL